MSVQTKNGRSVKAHIRYRNRNNKIIPGATTITGILNKPALVHWSWGLGMEGIDYRAFRDDKAEIGTLVHSMVFNHLRNEEFDFSENTPKQVELAKIAFDKFLDWEKGHKVKPILLETPLISEEFQYGGTFDNYCKLDGILTLLDYKTSKDIFPEMYYQLAAYSQLLIENGYRLERGQILRLGRNEEEGFDLSPIVKDFSLFFEVFKNCLNIYNLQKRIRAA